MSEPASQPANPAERSPRLRRSAGFVPGVLVGAFFTVVAILAFLFLVRSADPPPPPGGIIQRTWLCVGDKMPGPYKSWLEVTLWLDSSDPQQPGNVFVRTAHGDWAVSRSWSPPSIGSASSWEDAKRRYGEISIDSQTDSIQISGTEGVKASLPLRQALD
ncbi:MAG: hypothetical protein K2Y21_04740 [Phycisphaerales bacterium]|nr:hypothetical protein [Phycisphaerales bacterium]